MIDYESLILIRQEINEMLEDGLEEWEIEEIYNPILNRKED